MSRTEYHHRVVVELQDSCGRWQVALWAGSEPGTEQAAFHAEASVQARRVWGQVADDERHGRLLVDLDGWAGWRLHPVTTYRRWVNDDGSVSGWHVHAELDGTRLVEGGCLVPDDDAVDRLGPVGREAVMRLLGGDTVGGEVAGDDRRMT